MSVPPLCTLPVLLSSLASEIGWGLCSSSNAELISCQMVVVSLLRVLGGVLCEVH